MRLRAHGRVRGAVLVALAIAAVLALSGCGTAVPDVVGKPVAGAEKALTAAGFRAGKVTHDKDAAGQPGDVVTQDPKAGDLAKEGTAVDLTVAGPPPVPAPDVVGLDKAKAQVALEASGLELGDVMDAFDAAVASGLVVSQSPEAGSEVPHGSGVDVVLSRGPQPVAVPNVVGKKLADARAVLEALGFKVQSGERSDAAAKGTVVVQAPVAGAKLAPGQTVRLTVSSGVAMVKVPNVAGMWGNDADAKIRAAGLVPVEVSIHGPIESDAADIGRAYRQNPKAGTMVPKGSKVSYHSWWEAG